MATGLAMLQWSAPRLAGGRPARRVIDGREISGEVVARVVDRVLAAARAPGAAPLLEIVHETVSCEQARPVSDPAFVATLSHALGHATAAELEVMVRRIVARYAAEISGHFDPKVYALATRALPSALARLLGGGEVDQRLLIEGELDALRRAAVRGTVVLLPTHVSNLDSLIMGYAIYRLGLPPFAYAAGLNLFSNVALGFFMRNLGAYTVDRQNKDPLYRATLKEYATVLLERGQHGLWFPGGTRSRSGEVETKLKLGLLGATHVAQWRTQAAGSGRPIFVVPCTLTYPLVLEASSLIAEALRREGGPRYVAVEDEFSRPRRWAAFFRGLNQLDLQVRVRFGAPLDVLGNPVDAQGRSLDPKGRPVDLRGYFTVRGQPAEDAARDAEYARELAAAVVAAYRRDTVALPTSVLAYAVFERARRRRPGAELVRLLRGVQADVPFSAAELATDVERLVARIRSLVASGELHAAPALQLGAREVIAQALETFGTYHPVPVLQRRGDAIAVLDAELLYYYRNRLAGHRLGEVLP